MTIKRRRFVIPGSAAVDQRAPPHFRAGYEGAGDRPSAKVPENFRESRKKELA
jgi:hypothetical protein